MDADRWRAQQREVRELLRSRHGGLAQSGAASAGDLAPPADGSTPQADFRAPLADAPATLADDRAPLASVIVVCWNASAVLERCLDRLLEQDYTNYEVVVVDDGSHDETPAIAEQVSSRGPRAGDRGAITVLRSARNRGVTYGRNLGLEHARGEIVAFIDADGFASPDWLRRIVETFGEDATIGGVASTVFFEANPLVINGAGGIVNRQGWAADRSMNEPYEFTRIASETLYPMGCGMALRRSALERVGPFDDRMINYYDDVDYGTRLWRAGFRVVVAPEAWVDHAFGQAAGVGRPGGDSARKQLLCERHRIRVVLKHDSMDTIGRWAIEELRSARRAQGRVRVRRLRAIGWNALHLPSVLASRLASRRSLRVPARLVDRSWGDGYPAGVPSITLPQPGRAGNRIDMGEPASEGQLLYGWFPPEHADGRSYRWARTRAAVLIGLEQPARRLRLDYAHVPVDVGGVDVCVRRLDSPTPLAPVWETRLPWQYTSRSVENHPVVLPPGDYEVLFSALRGWLEPPLETRSLGLALAGMSFESSYAIAAGGLNMATPGVEEQLVRGWFEAEHGAGRSYRWAMRRAEAVVRLTRRAERARLNYRFPSAASGGLNISAFPMGSEQAVCSLRIAAQDDGWHEDALALSLDPGDYLLAFEAESSWSNPGQRLQAFPPENRSLGFALSSLSLSVEQ